MNAITTPQRLMELSAGLHAVIEKERACVQVLATAGLLLAILKATREGLTVRGHDVPPDVRTLEQALEDTLSSSVPAVTTAALTVAAPERMH